MDKLEKRLSKISGKILDVAAGRGSSLKYLIDNINGCEKAIGIDFSEKNLKQAHVQFDDE